MQQESNMEQKNLYEIFIQERAKSGKRNSSLSDMLGVDEFSQTVLLSEQILRTLKEFAMSDDNMHVKCNEYGYAVVITKDEEDKYSHAKCENNQLDLKSLTKIASVEIARLFPNVSQILEDIREIQAMNKPALPNEVMVILNDYKEWNKYIPSYTQERLLCGMMSKNQDYISVNSEWLFNLCLQVGFQMRNTFIKNKVVKVGLTNQYKESFGSEIYNRIISLDEEEVQELFNLWINSKN